MTKWRRIALAGLVLAGIYGAAVTAGSYYLTSRLRTRLVERLETTFGGKVTVGSMDVSLWRGTALAQAIVIEPGATGLATGRIDRISARFARGGQVLWSRELDALAVGNVELALPMASLTKLRRSTAKRPLWANRVAIDRVEVSISPTSVFAGLLATRLRLERVVAGRTELRSAVSWLQSVTQMHGHLSVPVVGGLELSLANKRLSLAGSMLPRAISVAYDPPVMPADASDGERVRGMLRHIGGNIAEELGGAWVGERLRGLLTQ